MPKLTKPKKDKVKKSVLIKNPVGRPSEFDVASPKIIEYLRTGNTYECASACARVSYSSFHRWIKQGEEDDLNGIDSKYCKFWKDAQQAEMEAEFECVQAWRSFIPTNWQAARDFLARRNPDKWSSKEKVDVTSNGETTGIPVFLPMKKSDDE